MAISFKSDIVPLFRPVDVQHMVAHGVHLTDYDYMSDPAGDDTFDDHAHALHVYMRLTGVETQRMPPNGPYWSQDHLDTLLSWIMVKPRCQP